VTAEQAGDRLDEDELLATTFLLMFAGHETTVHLISSGVLALLDHPDQKAKLTADWSKAGSAVDEAIRFVSPVQMTKPRYASRDLDLHGRSIRRGDVFVPLLAAANSDPARFDHPERFDISRHPNPHLGFGTGIHVCLGMKLARTEAEIAFERIFTRFPDLALSVPSSELAWTKKIGMRSLYALPMIPGESGKLAETGRIT
jgi:cytochrome P450